MMATGSDADEMATGADAVAKERGAKDGSPGVQFRQRASGGKQPPPERSPGKKPQPQASKAHVRCVDERGVFQVARNVVFEWIGDVDTRCPPDAYPMQPDATDVRLVVPGGVSGRPSLFRLLAVV